MHKSLNDALIAKFLEREFATLGKVFPHARALDLGCGDMRYAKHFERNNWLPVYSDHEVRAKGVQILIDAHSLPFADGVFDVINMTEVLEHLHHPSDALKEIARVLAPNGRVLITFPFMWMIHEVPHDYFRYTEFGFAVLAKDAGLTIERFYRRGGAFGLMLSLVEIKILGLAHVMSKRPILSLFGRLLDALARGIAAGSFHLYLLLTNKTNTRAVRYPGENLDGALGKLRLWTLGYNFVLKKVATNI